MCGGTRYHLRIVPKTRGLSPRVRGNPDRHTERGRPRRSIPACAGEPPGGRWCGGRSAVYPRVCGGTPRKMYTAQRSPGLSPRVRGNRVAGGVARAAAGSIPACAGEPISLATPAPSTPVYPRVCGGTASLSQLGIGVAGLSPRVRGNPGRTPGRRPRPGSIPACAGEPARRPRGRPGTAVYPRVCGGTALTTLDTVSTMGLSPRVRGNPCRRT